MKRRELLTWVTPVVTVVALPAHALITAPDPLMPWEECDIAPESVWCEGAEWLTDENGEYICDHPLCVEARNKK